MVIRLSIVKMSSFTIMIYRFNTIPIKIPIRSFVYTKVYIEK